MIRVKYYAKKDPKKLSSPYWQVGYQDPSDRYRFIPCLPYNHYTTYESSQIAELLNNAVTQHVEMNHIPVGNSDDLLSVKVIDPNDGTESQKSLDILSGWLGTTDRLREVMKGTLIERLDELRVMIINRLEGASGIDLKKDSQGNLRAYKRTGE